MNEQEAISVLKDKHTDIGTTNCDDLAWRKLTPAIDTAISALEKQIPKKVLNRQELKDFYGRCYRLRGNCPECTSIVLQSNFCEWCGQKLDWVEPYSEDSL